MGRRCLIVVLSSTVAAAAVGIAASGAAGDGGGASPGVSILGDGVLARNGEIRYVAVPDGTRTQVVSVFVKRASLMASVSVRGAYGIPYVANDGTTGGLSHDGHTLVLAEIGTGLGLSPSRFAVVDTRRMRVRKVITLRGNFGFDAISPGGKRLYLIEHVSAKDFTRYRVRSLDVATGRLEPRVIVDHRAPNERMAGYPQTRATSPDGTWAYTLYQKPNGASFIHALDTRRAEAVCIDLPRKETKSWIGRSYMRVSRDGTKLVLRVYGTNRTAAVVDTRTFRVSVTA